MRVGNSFRKMPKNCAENFFRKKFLLHKVLGIKLIALYPYESRVDGDISFDKGDMMILLDDSKYVNFCIFNIF